MWATPTALPFQNFLHKSLGQWGGLPVIAIGPRGGKIVGYGTGGKPIYAGSPKAQALTQYRRAAQTTPIKQLHEVINEWLVEVGVPNKVVNEGVWVNPEAGQMIVDSYGVKPVAPKPGKPWVFSLAALKPHVGKPLVPHGAEKVVWAAKAAAGELDKDPFPKDLSALQEIPAGKAAGSHGNRLFKSPDGRKWLFKTHDNVIARAEEAASRLGRLVFGPDLFAAAKYVKLAGQDGVLMEWKHGSEIPQGSYHQTTEEFIGQHFEELVEHQVFDWLISNHDSHAGNFLVKDGKLIAIDKGQAWRFFGKDELSADYSPNPSKPVYVKLWSMVAAGKIPKKNGDPFEAASRVLERIDKITAEQFREIIAPYVATRAKKEGKDPAKMTSQMVERLVNLRTDWAKFLAGETKSSVTEVMLALQPTPKPGVDVVQKPAPLKLVEPEKPAVIEGGAKAPVQTSKPAPGWPQTKGKVTITHPGLPPAALSKWPAGYPGPGFQASIDYKHQHYDVEFKFSTGPTGMRVIVYYPDGTDMEFDSPNKASDSLYLYHQKLPLTMSATEKKAKGISYPASKAFGILAFKQELAEAQGGELPASAKTVEELETEGTVQKDQETVPAELEGLSLEVAKLLGVTEKKKPSLPNWETMPENIPKGHTKAEIAAWLTAAPTGVKIHVPSYGTITKLSSTGLVWTDADGTEGSLSDVSEIASEQGVTEIIYAKPEPTPAPVTAGVKETVVKKPGLGDVVLQPQPDGTYTVGFTFKDFPKIQNFKTISAAAKFAFVHQKGYASVADYEAATGKKAPGVSWGYFGLDPKQQAAIVETKPAATPETKPIAKPEEWTSPTASWEQIPHPTAAEFKAMEPGTKLRFLTGGLETYWKRVMHVWYVWVPEKGDWQPGDLENVMSDAGDADTIQRLEAPKVEKPATAWPEGAVALNILAPHTMDGYPVGTELGWKVEGLGDIKAIKLIKQKDGEWKVYDMSPDAQIPSLLIGSGTAEQMWDTYWSHEDGGAYKKEAAASPLPTIAEMTELPVGTKMTWKSITGWLVSAVKTGPDSWAYKVGEGKSVALSSSGIASHFDDTAEPATLTTEAPKPSATTMLLGPIAHEQAIGWPVGTVLSWHHPAGKGLVFATKKDGPSTWEVAEADTEPVVYKSAAAFKDATANALDNEFWVELPEPTAPGYKPMLQTGGLPTTTAQIQKFLKGTSIKVGEWEYKKYKADGWNGYKDGKALWAGDDAALAEKVHAKKALVKVPPASKLAINVKLPSTLMPPGTHEKVSIITESATKWATLNEDQKIASGTKPPGWAPWIPPPGVLIEGKVEGKTFWALTATAGYNAETGEPWPNTSIALLGEDGSIYSSDKVNGKVAIKSLAQAAKLAGLTLTTDQIKKVWNLDNIVFAPGETYLTVKDGTGPSEIPMAATVEEPATEMTPVMKKQIVKAAFPLNDALKKHPVGKDATLTPQKNGKYHWLAIPNGTTDQLAQLVKDFGFDEQASQIQQVNDGAKVLIPSWAINHEVVITTTAFVAASAPKTVSPDNFETMPDGVPMKFTGEESDEQVQAALQKVPIGTSIVEGSLVYTLSDAGWSLITHEGQKKLTEGEVAHMIALYGGTVVPPGVEKPEFVPKTFTPKIEWKVTAEAVAKAEKAKAALTWSKSHPPVTDTEHVFVLSHLQALLGPKVKFWARQGGPNDVLVGSDSPKFAKAMKAAGFEWESKPNVKTPFGSMKRYNVTALKDALPSAGTITGPDGNTYPAGTTFEQQVSTKTVQHAILGEPAFYKFSDHKTDATKQVLKIKGTGADQIDAANKIIEKYGLKTDPDFGPITGSGNTIVVITKQKLAEVIETKTITVPQVPPQPPAFFSQPLPFEGAAAAVGQPIGNNRHDLKMLDALKPSRLGHPVLIGKNVWRDGQVFVRKVRDKSGTTRYEIHGDIPFFDPSKTKGMTAATVTYQSTAGTNYEGYGYAQQTYEAETGTQVDEGSKSGRSYQGVRGTTPGGSTVWVTTSGTSSVKGTFRVDVAPGQDPEKELAAACEMAGLNVEDAMAEPTADDLRVLKKLQIVQSLKGPMAFGSWLKPEWRNEEWLDGRLKDFKFPAEKVEAAELRVVANGKIATVVNDDDKIEEAKKKGLRFVYVGHESVGGLVSRVREGGYASNKRRSQNGVVGNPTSMSGDENVGGSWAVFARIAHTDQGSSFGGVKGGTTPKIVFHPRVLNRTDWYWHSGDKYGSTQDGTSSRYIAMNDGGGTSNEILFVDSLSIKDAAGIAVWDQQTKQKVMQELIAAGFADGINGIPLDKFVVATATGDRDEIANLMEGLKPGVLP